MQLKPPSALSQICGFKICRLTHNLSCMEGGVRPGGTPLCTVPSFRMLEEASCLVAVPTSRASQVAHLVIPKHMSRLFSPWSAHSALCCAIPFLLLWRRRLPQRCQTDAQQIFHCSTVTTLLLSGFEVQHWMPPGCFNLACNTNESGASC